MQVRHKKTSKVYTVVKWNIEADFSVSSDRGLMGESTGLDHANTWVCLLVDEGGAFHYENSETVVMVKPPKEREA